MNNLLFFKNHKAFLSSPEEIKSLEKLRNDRLCYYDDLLKNKSNLSLDSTLLIYQKIYQIEMQKKESANFISDEEKKEIDEFKK